jgi:hypothetical protein
MTMPKRALLVVRSTSWVSERLATGQNLASAHGVSEKETALLAP